MNHAALMRVFQGFANLASDGQRLFQRNRALRNALRQRWAFYILEGERMNAVRLFEAIDRADIRMVERCQHLRFPPKTREPVRIAGESRRKDLDGNLAVQLCVAPE